MAVKIRLARHGAKKYPYYRVVVADGRSPRDGRFICEVGRYNPNTNPKLINLDLDLIDEWVSKGAQPTDTVARLVKIAKDGGPVAADPSKKAPSKKAQAKAAAAAQAAAAPAEGEEAEEAPAE